MDITTNTSYNDIKDIKYGSGYLGNNRTLKTRLCSDKATAFMSRIPKSCLSVVKRYTTVERKVFIAIILPVNSIAWSQIDLALEDIKKLK